VSGHHRSCIRLFSVVLSAIRLPGDKDTYAKEFSLDESMKRKVDVSVLRAGQLSFTSVQLDTEIRSSVRLNTTIKDHAMTFNNTTFKSMKVLITEVRQLAIAATVRPATLDDPWFLISVFFQG
jgi:hypothetical protein